MNLNLMRLFAANAGGSTKTLNKEIVTLKEQINFLKVKLDIAIDLVCFNSSNFKYFHSTAICLPLLLVNNKDY